MKRIFSTAILGAALMALASVPASASTLTVFVSASQIISAANAISGAFAGACGAGTHRLNGCGVFEVGFVSDSSAVGSIASTAQTVSAFPQYWSAPTILFTGTTADAEITGGTGTTERLITSDGTAPTGAYLSNNAAVATNAGSIFGASDTTDGITFTLTTSAVADGLDNITLLLRAVVINANGSEGTGKGSQNITVQSTLTSTATPEPSSVLFMVSGIAAIGFGKLRLRRRQS